MLGLTASLLAGRVKDYGPNAHGLSFSAWSKTRPCCQSHHLEWARHCLFLKTHLSVHPHVCSCSSVHYCFTTTITMKFITAWPFRKRGFSKLALGYGVPTCELLLLPICATFVPKITIIRSDLTLGCDALW